MYRLNERDDLLCDHCQIGSKRYQGQLYAEHCIDCVAHDFEVRFPMTGLFEGFWRDHTEWQTDKVPWELLPTAEHEWGGAPYPWETWIEEAPIGRVYAGW